MKKQLLLGGALLLSAVAFPQNARKIQPSGVSDMAERLAAKYAVINSPVESPSAGTAKVALPNVGVSGASTSEASSPLVSATFTLMSGSMNIFGMLVSNSKPLSYNRYLQTVCFIQRKSSTYQASPAGDSNTGTILGYLGKNNGTMWDSTVIWANATNQARYPQGGIYNPPGNTDIANAYVVGTGPVTTGSGWVGSWYASKMYGTGGTNSAGPDQQFFSNGGPFNSTTSPNMTKHDFPRYNFAVTDDGLMRTAGTLYQDVNGTTTLAQNIRGALVAKGTFVSGVFTWTPDSFLPPCIMRSEGTKQLWGQPYVAFNEAGTVGYVVMIGARQGATLANKGWQPIVYKTTNSGNTWALVNGIDFNSTGWDQILNSMATVNTSSTLAVPFFNVGEGIDVAVDANNKLHIFSTVVGTARTHDDSLAYTWQFTSEGYGWLHQNTARPYLIDFMGDGAGAWSHVIVDSASTEGPSSQSGGPGFNSNPWANQGQTNPVASDLRLQIGRSYDGQYIVYSWAESDTTLTTGSKKWNEFPNIKTRAYRVCDGKVSTDEYGIPATSAGGMNSNGAVKDKAYFHYMSSQVMAGASTSTSATFTVPFTVTNNSSTDGGASVRTLYCNAVIGFAFPSAACGNTITTSLNKYDKNAVTTRLYPNPAKDNVTINVTQGQANDIQVELYNALGQKVATATGKGYIGENNINMSVSGLNAGVYFVKVKSGNYETTNKLVVE